MLTAAAAGTPRVRDEARFCPHFLLVKWGEPPACLVCGVGGDHTRAAERGP